MRKAHFLLKPGYEGPWVSDFTAKRSKDTNHVVRASGRALRVTLV